MHSSFKLILVIVAAVLSVTAAILVYSVKSRGNPAAEQTVRETVIQPTLIPIPTISTVSVTAEGGILTPSEFTVSQHHTLLLDIEAKDRDYAFSIADFRTAVPVPQGQITRVELYGEAVGTHAIDCGEGCTGILTVPDNDGDEVDGTYIPENYQ